jgi:hypothetical protein
VPLEAPSDESSFPGTWAWLFPATYLVHIAEEYWGAPGLYVWASSFLGVNFTARVFLAANALFFAVMVAAVVLVIRRVWDPWVLVALGTVVTINALAHLLGTAVSGAYSPGLVSGVLLWLPLGLTILVRARRVLSARAVRRGLVVGVVAHFLLPAVGFTLSQLLNP